MHWLERLAFLLAFVSPELTYFAPYAVPPVLLAALYFQLREACAHATEGRETPEKQGTSLEAPNGSVAA
jgi:hypothetical protein